MTLVEEAPAVVGMEAAEEEEEEAAEGLVLILLLAVNPLSSRCRAISAGAAQGAMALTMTRGGSGTKRGRYLSLASET